MTIDYNDPDEIVLGKNLKAGDCIRARKWTKDTDSNDMAIIIATTFGSEEHAEELRWFYEGKPAYEFYEINYTDEGSMTARLDPEQEFHVIRSRKDILYIYKTVDYELLARAEYLRNKRNELMIVKKYAINHMNERQIKLKGIKNETGSQEKI